MNHYLHFMIGAFLAILSIYFFVCLVNVIGGIIYWIKYGNKKALIEKFINWLGVEEENHYECEQCGKDWNG